MTGVNATPDVSGPSARYWPDGDIVTPEVEALLARMADRVRYLQARGQS